jgi:uncharacterized protein YndB with AHSA1/START domain
MKRFLLLILITAPAFATTEPFVHAEVIVDASAEQVWNAWTTTEGVKSWFAPGANIEPKVGGAYEIFFAPDEPAGQRGADGMRILLFQPQSALAFTWNAPAKFGERRNQLTHVIVRLYPISEKQTRVTLTHSGFGLGAEWDAVRAYFDGAWSQVVLPRLQARFNAAQQKK